MRRAILFLALSVVALAIAACGSGTTTVTKTVATPGPAGAAHQPALLTGPSSCNPGVGAGTMGACAPKFFNLQPGLNKLTLSGKLIVDVSSYQDRPNWAAAKGSIAGAIPKAGEGFYNGGGPNGADSSFVYNWQHLRSNHIWHAAYWFLRPGDCAAEARRFVAIVNSQGGFDSGPPVADAEVPLNSSCVSSFAYTVENLIHWTKFVTYTGPGTWPGGSHANSLLWGAAYGPKAPCVWTCSIVAWQFTGDGIGPNPHCVTGVGCSVDVSKDYGILTIRHTKPKPNLKKIRAHLSALYVERRKLRAQQRWSRQGFSCIALRDHKPPYPHGTHKAACVALFAQGNKVNVEIARIHRVYHV